MTEWHTFKAVMIPLFYRFFRSIARIFSGRNLWGHLLAIVLTVLLVTSGFDGWYFAALHRSRASARLYIGVKVGSVLPVLLPLILLGCGWLWKRRRVVNLGWALGQAALLGWLVTSFYKVFTGRPGPHFRGSGPPPGLSRVFRFGFWRGGIFWGWPSSHTAVAFAIAFTVVYFFPRSRIARLAAPLYALVIAAGVSMSIHWFSDVVAGAIIGGIIGSVVGICLRERSLKTVTA
jgi:membrane-associated phospholipid phosphatase